MPYVLLDPFEFDSSNPVEVQKAGRRIADHLGLQDCTFVISYVPQGERHAGKIHIDTGNEVFVEVDPQFRGKPEIVLYILSHELCHKLLYRRGIVIEPLLENEILTDIATVFFGLGKLALNGCESFESLPNVYTGQGGKLKRLGYINLYHFAYTYYLLCKSHKSKPGEFFNHLKSEVIHTIDDLKRNDDEHFSDSLFDPGLISKLFNKSIEREVHQLQLLLATYHRNLRILLRSDNQQFNALHVEIKQIVHIASEDLRIHQNHPPYLFLKNLKYYLLFKSFGDKNKGFSKNLKKSISESGNEIRNSTSATSRLNIADEGLREFNCPVCAKSMRISEFKLARVTCPKCNYIFFVDCRIELKSPTLSISGFYQKIASTMKRRHS